MNLAEIEGRVAAIEPQPGVGFLEDLLRAYGLPNASIKRLMGGSYDKAETALERLWKDKVYFRYVDASDDVLYDLIDGAREDERVVKYRPRFLILKNDQRLLAGDQKTGATLDIEVGELSANSAFFLPWAGIEKTQLENLNYADVKAAEKMARLYDEITKHNAIETEADIHDLNVFFSRLLFCFFAEDTGVFEKGIFTNAIGSYTRESGEDVHGFLDELFEVLDTEPEGRKGVPEHVRNFGYVNGNLFASRCPAPRFSGKARAVVLECGTLDWSAINPDIFGSMIQAVVQPSQRAGLGMHYTSVENIMKVIRPLFLDDLEQAFDKAGTVKKLDKLLERIAAIKVFDPACGSGNFLVIAYKELRRLEHRILQRTMELDPSRAALFNESALKLENYYGIEIADFAHEIAILSLWLAKHQMNVEFKERFGAEIPLIPLRDAGNIVCGNAVRLDWTDVCDPETAETYLLGNPPYAGSKVLDSEQRTDFASHFGSEKYPKTLDYISLWFFRGAAFLSTGPNIQVAFVSTNSISQGDHVGLMWPRVFERGAQISFAHQSFRWSNQARGNAGVTCVVVGLVPSGRRPRNLLYTEDGVRTVRSISPYLTEGDPSLIVHASRRTVHTLPPMAFGNLPNDGGHLSMTGPEKDSLLAVEPEARRFIRRFTGAAEFLRGVERYCIWIEDNEIQEAEALPEIKRRIDLVAAVRRRAPATAQAMVSKPYRFQGRRHRETTAILIPLHTSERRDYIPMDFVGPETVISNAANAVYDAEPWLFALLQSRMHMTWIRAVAGRMKTDIRYSAGLVYNTFPAPEISDADRGALTQKAIAVLTAREQFPGQTLAQLYDPDKMPHVLRSAHTDVDLAVDALYREKPFESDAERLELLFEMYEAATREEVGANA